MIQAAHDLGTENLLVVAGSTYIPWITDHEPGARSTSATAAPARRSASCSPWPRKLGVSLNIENIFFNGYLMTPAEMNAFVDSFQSEHVRVHFDTGNIMLFQFPEHWIPLLGPRIKNVHFKEFTKKGTDHSLESFRHAAGWHDQLAGGDGGLRPDRLQGLSDLRVLPPVPALSGGLIYQTSDALDRMLGRKA